MTDKKTTYNEAAAAVTLLSLHLDAQQDAPLSDTFKLHLTKLLIRDTLNTTQVNAASDFHNSLLGITPQAHHLTVQVFTALGRMWEAVDELP